MVTQQDIAKALGMSRTVIAKVLNRDPNYRASAATRQRVFEAARRLGYDFSQLRPLHRRLHHRQAVDLPAHVSIRLSDGRPYTQGHARVLELSLGGAKVGDFRVSPPTLPLKPFRIDLIVEMKRGQNMSLSGLPTRVEMRKGLAFGLRFGRLSASTARTFSEFLARLRSSQTP